MQIDIMLEIENIMRTGLHKHANKFGVDVKKVEILLGLESIKQCLVLIKKDNLIEGRVKLSSLLGAKMLFQSKINDYIVNLLIKHAKKNDIKVESVFIVISINVNNKILFWLQDGTKKQIKALTEEEILAD